MKTFNLQEAADYLKIHKKTAEKMVREKELPGIKIGRAWVFIEEDLAEYLRMSILTRMHDGKQPLQKRRGKPARKLPHVL